MKTKQKSEQNKINRIKQNHLNFNQINPEYKVQERRKKLLCKINTFLN